MQEATILFKELIYLVKIFIHKYNFSLDKLAKVTLRKKS